jgi:hypothetical protein
MENRSKRAKSADSNFKAMGKGERTSKKVSTIRTASGTSFRRKNANQYGAAEGGNDYTEKRVNRTDSFETGGTADSAENGGANVGGTLGSSMMKKGGGVGQVKAKAWIITEEGGLPKIRAYKSIMEAHDNVFEQGGHQINSLSRLKDVLSSVYDINNVEPYMYVKQMANGGGLANVPESFPETDAMSYKKGGGVEKNSNYKKFGKDNSRLVNFDIDDLDSFESMQYDQFSNSMDKADALQILINNVEGDYSQLNEQLAEIAEEQYPSDEFFEDNRQYKKGGSTKGFEYSIGGL